MAIKGKYAEGNIFAKTVEDEALKQVLNLLDQPFTKGSYMAFMPDIHAGKGCVIGTTMNITEGVCPNLVGVDIGCGMLVIRLRTDKHDLAKLDEVINTLVPSGFDVHKEAKVTLKSLKNIYNVDLTNIEAIKRENLKYYLDSVGTLGGGNHFIELAVNPDDNHMSYLIIHTGSRNLGVKVANYHQKKAINLAYREYNAIQEKQIIADLKSQGKEYLIQETLKKAKENKKEFSEELAYLPKDSKEFDDYINDMQEAQKYASANRQEIANIILEAMYEKDIHNFIYFETVHNYIEMGEKLILRKGAVSAKKDELLLIPMNMRDGSLLCFGKGNPDWNESAAHGAGRKMSRSVAKKTLSMEEFKDTMSKVYTTSVVENTLDEAPMAYKDTSEIVELLKDTVTVYTHLVPIYNFKNKK